MANDATLRLDLYDVYRRRLDDRVTVRLRSLRSGGRGRVLRDRAASKVVTIPRLDSFPHGRYAVTVESPARLPIGRIVWIPASNEERLALHLPVDPDRVEAVEFEGFDGLPGEAVRLLETSEEVLGFEGRTGEDLYQALDDIRRAGFLNIVAKCAATILETEASVLSKMRELRELRGDRFFAVVPHELREDVKNAVATGLFHPVSDLLHHPPAGYDRAGSFKTDDRYGNLQLTFFAGEGEWVADIDIDDSAGLGHVFQVLGNALSGRATHPYDIHEILVLHQGLDPLYRFEV